MLKKIMVLSASPNKDGNTATLVKWFSEGAKSKGAIVEVVDVAHLKYKTNGCTACMGCQKSDKYRCVIDDEASVFLSRIPHADVVVFATPLYFFGPSAQLKLFLDRMYSLFKFDETKRKITHTLHNKVFALIASAAGDVEPGLKLLQDTFQAITDLAGIKFEYFLVPLAGDSGQIKDKKKIQDAAFSFGKRCA